MNDKAYDKKMLAEIGELLRTQDNRITDQPIFLVQREVTDWGFDSAYSDDYKWLNPEDEHCEATEEEAERLEELEDMLEETEPWEKAHYKKRWEFVTACFTEQGCKDYISRNGHNLGKCRIYADGTYRNIEYQTVRNFLIKQSN